MKNIKQLVFILILNLLSINTFAQDQTIKITDADSVQTETKSLFPKMTGVVSDYGKVFTVAESKELTKLITDFTAITNRKIVLLTVDNIGAYNDMREYATGLKNDWEVGFDSGHNSLTLALCVPCRGVGVATGINSETFLTDEVCKDAIQKTMVPEFTAGNYYSGIKKGILKLMENWK